MPRADSPLLGRMVFVVGEYRSGTNWLVRLLGLHPDVAVIPAETHLLSDGIAVLRDRVQFGLPTSPRTGAVYMDRDAFLDAARDLCDLAFDGVARAVGSRPGRVVEHTPAHVRHLDLVGAVYPDAAVVHIIRDGRDVARSLAAQAWGPASLAESARRWVDSVSSARAAAPGLASYHEIRYEDLLADPAGRMLALFGALGLPTPPELGGRVAEEARVEFNSDVADPRIGPGKWRGVWTAAELQTVETVQGPVLRGLGYPPPGPRDARPDPPARGRIPVRLRSVASGRARAAAGRARSVARRVEGRLRGRPARRAPGYEMDQAQVVVDRFFEELAGDRPGAAADLLAPDADVRTVTGGEARDGRGSAGRQLLEKLLADRASVVGAPNRPRRSETFVVHNRVGVILSFPDAPDGPVDELFVVAVRGGVLTSLRYHRFPTVSG